LSSEIIDLDERKILKMQEFGVTEMNLLVITTLFMRRVLLSSLNYEETGSERVRDLLKVSQLVQRGNSLNSFPEASLSNCIRKVNLGIGFFFPCRNMLSKIS
jgi:hypothetical protein